MSFTPENQQLNTEELISEIKKFREAAENRLMAKNEWVESHRLKLKNISDKLFNIQIDLNELD